MGWSDDPVRDALRHFNDIDERERRCLHCVVCGTAIWDDEPYYEIEEQEFCPDCMRNEFLKYANYEE